MTAAFRILAVLGIFAAALAPRADAKPTPPPPLRSAINLCDLGWFYSWPSESSLPVRAHFQPAHIGERFEIQRGPLYSLGGGGYYETTIPAFAGGGTASAFYWISDRCVNPAPLPTPAPTPRPT
jgi:hypothetical protein